MDFIGECICQINNGLCVEVNLEKTKISSNSHWVELAVRGSNSFLEEMEMIDYLYQLYVREEITEVI
ncbi:hypothetical protein GCM10011339_34850 [Echinicola rosea]|uniref:Uncharacterized protein n=1 Tax=Echinicola rosea TaxID=1807691 RepID=A0ABQ1V885_9BACT|nr:hypothetical protein GCM10011339_34850 [Echinicola rosea]